MRWTEAHLQKLLEEGKIRGYTIVTKPDKKKIPTGAKPRKQKPAPLVRILNTLKLMGIEHEEEFKFLDDRKFRFDIMLPAYKTAIEYEGIMATKSRHTTVTGYSKDATKYNRAVLDGWKVLRYTTLNYKEVMGDLQRLIENAKL